MFTIEPQNWSADSPEHYSGVVLTSANAVRYAGPQLQNYILLPCFVVGPATAEAATASGFSSVTIAKGTAARLLKSLAPLGLARVLHLSGADVTPVGLHGLAIERHVVYKAEAAELADNFRTAIARNPLVLLHSRRAAARFAGLVQQEDRSKVMLIAISEDVARAAGEGWEKVAIANSSSDNSMLELAARLCCSNV